MTHLRERMLEELQRHNYSEGTTQAYLQAVQQFAVHLGKSPDKLGPDNIRSYQAYLLVDASWRWQAWWPALRHSDFSSFERSSGASSGRSCPARSPIGGCRQC